MARTDWNAILLRAKQIVESYDTGVTLRQLYYQLVSEQLIPNQQSFYRRLSSATAEARREGWFPDLVDKTSSISEHLTFDSPADALDLVARQYRRDRTEGQDVSIYLGVEKDGIVNQLDSWFGRPLGIPVLPLGGYASQSYATRVTRHVEVRGRPAVLLYAGDHDPSGWDIDRDFTARTDCWTKVIRVALTPEQVAEYELPENPGKEADPRSGDFTRRFGDLVQVEVDALPPDRLRYLYQSALDEFWDQATYEDVVAREVEERAQLRELAENWDAS